MKANSATYIYFFRGDLNGAFICEAVSLPLFCCSKFSLPSLGPAAT